MKIKDGFILSNNGNGCIAVPVGEAEDKLSGFIRLNATGEYLWKQLTRDITEDELVARMTADFTGLDEATARHDLRDFLRTIDRALEK